MKTSWLITGILVTCGVGVSIAACGSSSTTTTTLSTSSSSGSPSSTTTGSPTASSTNTSTSSSSSGGGNGGSSATTSSGGIGGSATTTTTSSSSSSSSSGTCKVFSPYPAKMADGGGYESSLYCPFSGVDGGKAQYCDPGTEHCCETPSGSAMASACEPTGTSCISGSTDWGCENPTADCNTTNPVCCTINASALVASVIDAGACAYSTTPNITGTQCTTASACTTLGGLFLCGQDSECAAVGKTHCVPVYRDGNEFAACQ